MERESSLSFEMSRALRSGVEPGSMEYSAVTHPLPVSLRKGGTLSPTLAVQRTQVFPHLISALPAAYLV